MLSETSRTEKGKPCTTAPTAPMWGTQGSQRLRDEEWRGGPGGSREEEGMLALDGVRVSMGEDGTFWR